MNLGRIKFQNAMKACLLDTDRNGVPLNQDIVFLAKF